MDTNDWIQLFDCRMQQLAEALDEHRNTSPLATAKLEELLREVQHLWEDIIPPEG